MVLTDSLPKTKMRVLIADDTQETRRLVRLMLSINPEVVVVAIAKDGVEAVELAKEHYPDLVVMDLHMPKKDGLTACREIGQTYPDIGYVIISAELIHELPGDAPMPGLQEFLLKPFMVEELNDAVNRVAASVWKLRLKMAEAEKAYKQSETYLKPLALEYSKARRIDDEAVGVFEQLAQNPACELRWLQNLAMMYIIRREWSKLKSLASRLELQPRSQNK